MYLVPVHRRLPRAGIDPIDSADTAFVTVSLAVQRPLRHETVVVLLDAERRGISIVVVGGTRDREAVIEVLDCLLGAAAGGGRVGAVIVGSVRPDAATDGRDIDRWLEMSELAEQFGVDLLEWFVIADGVTCPRDQLGEPPRW